MALAVRALPLNQSFLRLPTRPNPNQPIISHERLVAYLVINAIEVSSNYCRIFWESFYLDRLTSHKRNYTSYTKVILLPSKLQKFCVLWILCKTHVILNDLLCIIMVLRNLQNPIYSFRIQDLTICTCTSVIILLLNHYSATIQGTACGPCTTTSPWWTWACRAASPTSTATASRDQLYNNRSSRKINSRSLFSRE